MRYLETQKNMKLNVFDVLAEVKDGWPMAKSIMTIVPILLAVSNPCQTFEVSSQIRFVENLFFLRF